MKNGNRVDADRKKREKQRFFYMKIEKQKERKKERIYLT